MGEQRSNISSSISRPAVALVIDATYLLNLGHHHITARIRFYPHGHMSAITELEAVLRGTADADTDGEDIEAFLPGRRTVTFDRSPKRQRVGAAPPATPPHAPRPRPPAPATPEMRHAPAVTQSPPGPPTAGGSSSDDGNSDSKSPDSNSVICGESSLPGWWPPLSKADDAP